jgi:hypothetical protein
VTASLALPARLFKVMCLRAHHADGFSSRRREMRTFVSCGLLLAAVVANTGCIVPIYSANRDVRARQLIYTSESLRQIPDIWERIWFLDNPDFETPYRTHGGVI